MKRKKSELNCSGCKHYDECKSKLKACEVYHNAVKGWPIGDSGKTPEFKWFDWAELGYNNIKINYSMGSQDDCWESARSVYESSTGQEFDPVFEEEARSWGWSWATQANKIVGGMGWEVSKESGAGIINFLYVRNLYKGRGIGSSLVNYTFHADTRLLTCPEYGSEEFYSRIGFKPDDRTKFLYSRDASDEH